MHDDRESNCMALEFASYWWFFVLFDRTLQFVSQFINVTIVIYMTSSSHLTRLIFQPQNNALSLRSVAIMQF